MHNFFIIITGPTGVGKSDLSYELVRRLPVEIINCDVGQFYTPLSIGTAKPRIDELPGVHHLFNYVDAPEDFSVVAYRSKVKLLGKQIMQRGNVPLIIGGSLFYIYSLFFPPHKQETVQKNDEADRSADPVVLWEQLYVLDPDRAQAIDAHDIYRIQRALDLCLQTEGIPSQRRPQFDPVGDFSLTFVSRNRDELYGRINQRVEEMFREGWVEEVEGLSSDWQEFLLAKKLIGYPEIIRCLQKHSATECTHDTELIGSIQKKTRHYAKRQHTFWRKLQRELCAACETFSEKDPAFFGECVELNLTLSPVDLYIDHIIKIIQKRQ